MRTIADTNEKLTDKDKEQLIIGSLDANSLYPSLDAEESGNICGKMIEESNLELRGVDWKAATKYLAVVIPNKADILASVAEYIPERYTVKGKKPTLAYFSSDWAAAPYP